MIKIAQIIDKETMGLQYLETYKQEILTQTITSGTHDFIAEVIEFDGETPIKFIRSQEFTVNLDQMNGQTIREILQGHI